MKVSDRLIGCFLILFAAAVLYQTRTFPVIPGQSIGSGLLPTIVALGLSACAIVMIARDLLNDARAPLISPGDWITDRLRVLRVGIVLVGTASFLFLLDTLGFPLLSISVLLAFLLSLRVSLVTALLVSVITSLAIHTLFSKLFLVPLPWGVLQSVAW